ncbi:hypothetical protein ACVWYG_002261 [Pedobacter sp. UYEF25]
MKDLKAMLVLNPLDMSGKTETRGTIQLIGGYRGGLVRNCDDKLLLTNLVDKILRIDVKWLKNPKETTLSSQQFSVLLRFEDDSQKSGAAYKLIWIHLKAIILK